MKKFNILLIAIFAALTVFIGCDEETKEFNTPYAVEIGQGDAQFLIETDSCLTIGLNIFIDDQFVGLISTSEPALVRASEGNHTVFARSNGGILDSLEVFWWTREVEAATDHAPVLLLNCMDAERIVIEED